jgi:hypothetical protein
MKMGWKKYEVQVINHEELWKMKLPKTSNELKKRMVQYYAWQPDYFDNE